MNMQNIPYGTTISYTQLSQRLNNPKAIRAVASSNGANSISILIPCHRVIGSDHKLTGYAGGLVAKKTYWNWNRTKEDYCNRIIKLNFSH